MKAFSLILCLLASPARAEDEATRVKLAEYILRTPMNEADPQLVAPFMKLDAQALPKRLRDKARGKQMEIDAVVKIHNGKKKGPFRFPAPDCVPKRYGPEGVRVMGLIIGNSEIAWEEEDYIEKKTNCTEDQLLCEFSLNVVVIPRKGKPPLRRFYLMESDPLMALVAEKRGGGGSTGKYFGELKPNCQKLAGSP